MCGQIISTGPSHDTHLECDCRLEAIDVNCGNNMCSVFDCACPVKYNYGIYIPIKRTNPATESMELWLCSTWVINVCWTICEAVMTFVRNKGFWDARRSWEPLMLLNVATGTPVTREPSNNNDEASLIWGEGEREKERVGTQVRAWLKVYLTFTRNA